MKVFPLKENIRKGQMQLGGWIQMASEDAVELMALSGFDFAIIDMEHGCMGIETVERLVRAADAVDMASIVRVVDNDPAKIMKALETGAAGVLIPGVSSAGEAARAVRAAKYAPMGMRGACPFVRSADHGLRRASDLTAQNEATMVVLLVEGRQAVEEFDELLAVNGVDSLMVGPVDLSFSLGVGGQIDHPLVLQAIAELSRKATDKGIPLMANIFDTDADHIRAQAARLRSQNISAIACNTDKMALASAFGCFVRMARAGWNG
jgi:4-hydroxy-2-oxoheptanedioate aldolase